MTMDNKMFWLLQSLEFELANKEISCIHLATPLGNVTTMQVWL